MPKIRAGLAAATVVFAVALVLSSPASATTFCVPGFHAACPAGDGHVAQANIEQAMQLNGSDGVPDTVIVDAGKATNPDTIDAAGTDDLEVIGAGPDKTTVTIDSNANAYVLSVGLTQRDVIVRDLKVLIPNTLPDLQGSGVATSGGVFQNVDFETQNPGSSAFPVLTRGVTIRNCRFYGTSGGYFPTAVGTTSDQPGNVLVEGTTIENATVPIKHESKSQFVTLKDSVIKAPDQFAVTIQDGASMSVANSVIETGKESAFSVYANTSYDSDLTLRNTTIVPSGQTVEPVFTGVVTGGSFGDVDIDVSDSVIQGFAKTWDLTAPMGISGNTYISIDHSNFNPVGSQVGDGTQYLSAGNINLDPMFVGGGNYELTAASPSVDAGNPAATPGFLDLAGRARLTDGNGDGVAVVDQGAYEFQPAASGPPVDTTAPMVSKVKFISPTATKAGQLKLRLSERSTVRAIFKPKPVGKGANKRATVALKWNGKTGANKLKIKKGKLKMGRYRLTIVATDAAGNRSKASVRKVRSRG